MKRVIAMCIMTALLVTACGSTSNFQDTDTDTASGDTVTADDTSAADTSAADTSDADTTVDDTAAPESVPEGIIYATHNYYIRELPDGTYSYDAVDASKTPKKNIYDEVFLLNHAEVAITTPVLVKYGTVKKTVYAVGEGGTVRSVVNADRVIALGDYFLADNTLYDAFCQSIYELMTPYYTFNGLTVNGAEYNESDGSIRFDLTVYDKPAVYTYYPYLPLDESIPEGAEEISRYETEGGLIRKILRDKDDYYYVESEGLYPENALILKLNDVGEYIIADNGDYGEARFTAIDGDKVTVTSYSYLFAESKYAGVMKMEYELYDGAVTEYNGAYVLSTAPKVYVVKDDEILHEFDYRRHGVIKVGEYLTVGENDYVPMRVLKPDLTLLDTQTFQRFFVLTDGNYIGWYDNTNQCRVFAPDGSIVHEFPSDSEVLKVDTIGTIRLADGTTAPYGDDHVLAKDADGHLRLYTPYGELFCDFGELEKDRIFIPLLGGYFTKEGYPTGVYFICEDRTDVQNNYSYRSYEYYYSFDTGEYGVIDMGYTDFAFAKPVLYLYPTEVTDVTVTFEHPERLTVDYPAYGDGWQVTANPDGTLTDSRGREYYALYWEESSGTAYYGFTDGFCVRGEDSAEFLEEKLARLGFTDKEANEFIIYWLPILESSEYNLIRFELTDEREASNALNISPAPDSLLRVAMHIKAVDAPTAIPEQTLPSFSRDGFVAVEWGGCVH